MARPKNQQDTQITYKEDNIVITDDKQNVILSDQEDDTDDILEEIDDNPLDLPVEDEETLLRGRALDLGIKLSNKDNLQSIRDKVNSKLNPKSEETSSVQNTISTSQDIRKKALKLIRVKINNLHPKESSKKGEIFTFHNSKTGTIKCFVPFGDHCGNDGTHIPQVILNIVQNVQYTRFKDGKDDKNRTIKIPELKPKYHVEILPPLTEKELTELKRRQAGKIT